VAIELISQPLKTSTLSVPDYYASIISESRNEYQVKFIFNIRRTDITEKNISKLKIKFYPENYNNQKKDKTKKIIDKQLIEYANIEDSKLEVDQLLLDTSIDLENLTKKPNKKRRILSQLPTRPTNSTNSNINLKDINLFIIKNIKQDPADVLQNYSEFLSYSNNIKNLVDYYTSTAIKNVVINYPRYSTIDEQSESPIIYASHIVKIPKLIKNAKFDKFDINFELYAKNETISSFQSISKQLDIESLFNKARSIKEPFFSGNTISNRSMLTATVKDDLADKLIFQKKTIDYNGLISRYETISEDTALKDNSIVIFDDKESAKLKIYRCISTVDKNNSDLSAYKNIIDAEISFFDSTVMLISNSNDEKAVQIELLNVPEEVGSYKIEKLLILPGSNGGIDGNAIVVSNYKTKDNNIVIDKNVMNGKTYEYMLTLLLKNGSSRISVKKLHKYIEKKVVISAEVSDAQLGTTQNGEASVSFNITSKIEQNTNELVKAALESAGISEQFADEIKGEKAFFQNLLFFKVKRINLSVSPGVEEEFNQFFNTGGVFNDDELTRYVSAVSNLDLSHSYRYEIRAFLKNPITLLPRYVKVIEGGTINGTYYKKRAYRPYKWFQKSALETGTLGAENEEGILLDSQFLQYDEIGVVKTVQMDVLKKILGVKNFLANRITLDKISLKWSINNSGDHYDHFVIVKEVNHIRTILTTTHNNSYVDNVNFSDAGNIRYYITPVYYDYTVGTTVSSQLITIDPEEYDQS